MGGKGRHVNFIGGPFFSSSSSFPFTFWEIFELLCFIGFKQFSEIFLLLFIYMSNEHLPSPISLKNNEWIVPIDVHFLFHFLVYSGRCIPARMWGPLFPMMPIDLLSSTRTSDSSWGPQRKTPMFCKGVPAKVILISSLLQLLHRYLRYSEDRIFFKS